MILPHPRYSFEIAKSLSGLAICALIVLPAPCFAAAPSGVLEAVMACQNIADDSGRLACFDAAIGRLKSAQAAGEVAVVDRDQVRQARRSAFGFNISMPDFLRTDEETETLNSLTSTIKSTGRASDGHLTITLEDGAIWRQVENIELSRKPKPGMTVEIKKAMMGSFMVKIDSQPAIRMSRDR